ncbi:MAG: 3-isopropylmalate dehydratase small subunit [Paralcaligenes sp.]
MQAFTTHEGLVAPMDRDNVDTDLIIPKQFLKSIKRTGFGENLFDELRYLGQGELGMDNSKRLLNPDFILNHSRYKGASILLSRKNFGCGSSRENAVWALSEYGFRSVIATSFADIFYNNSFKNGLLPIALEESQIERLFQEIGISEGFTLRIDLPNQVVTCPDGRTLHFDIEPFRKHNLMNGLDDIATTLQYSSQIHGFEKDYLVRYPWLERGTLLSTIGH